VSESLSSGMVAACYGRVGLMNLYSMDGRQHPASRHLLFLDQTSQAQREDLDSSSLRIHYKCTAT
jgi:hypothetical protein